jgi:hypothetical protein
LDGDVGGQEELFERDSWHAAVERDVALDAELGSHLLQRPELARRRVADHVELHGKPPVAKPRGSREYQIGPLGSPVDAAEGSDMEDVVGDAELPSCGLADGRVDRVDRGEIVGDERQRDRRDAGLLFDPSCE